MGLDAEVTDQMAWARSATEPDWNAVFEEQLPRVYNYFCYRLNNQADVEELTSRTFEKAWRARHRYRRELAGHGTWLLRIAHNVAIDHLRLAREYAPLEAALHTAADCGPETEQENASDQARLRSLLPTLPARERELLALKYGAGASNREIAGVTGLSESNVGTILHRTVQFLRERW
jgi:RNA polymerase sigma-70 factor (ECF subfamily)